MQLFARLAKLDSVQHLVYGRLTQEVRDHSNEIMDYESSRPEFERWSEKFSKATDGASLGNVRAMHGKVAAGKLVGIEYDDDSKSIDVVAKIIDAGEWEKCEEGVYTGFSVGGAYLKRWPDTDNTALTRYTAKPIEASLVDAPCVPTATFSMLKADGSSEERHFKASEGLLKQAWTCGNPAHTHFEKSAATACIHAQLATEITRAAHREEAADAEGPPAAQKEKPAPMEKGMNAVGQLAYLLDQLNALCISQSAEAALEGDDSQVPAALQSIVDSLAQVLVQMTEEETGEMTGDNATQPGEELQASVKAVLAKVGARHSEKDMKHLQAIHKSAGDIQNHAKAMGMEPPSGSGAAEGKDEDADENDEENGEEEGEEESQSAKMLAKVLKMLKIIAGENAELKKAVAEIAKSPAPAKAAVRAVAKSEDAGDGNVTDELGEIAKIQDPQQRALALVKFKQRTPIPLINTAA